MESDQLPTKTLPSGPISQQRQQTENKKISAVLSQLALHYWRPDYTPAQANIVMGDYLDDLRKYTGEEVAQACRQYRRLPDSKFFPTIGQLLDLLPAPEQPCRLPTFERRKYLEAPKATRSVAEVLRKHGMDHAAARWENRAFGDNIEVVEG